MDKESELYKKRREYLKVYRDKNKEKLNEYNKIYLRNFRENNKIKKSIEFLEEHGYTITKDETGELTEKQIDCIINKMSKEL